MHREQEIDREEHPVGIGLTQLLEDPDRDRDVDLEDHDTPPFAEIPVAKAREHKIEKTGNQRIFLYARPLA